jgi:hypothetical protein
MAEEGFDISDVADHLGHGDARAVRGKSCNVPETNRRLSPFSSIRRAWKNTGAPLLSCREHRAEEGDHRGAMSKDSYWLKLGLVYAATLIGALLCLFVLGIVAYRIDWLVFVAFLLPVIVGPVIFVVALARSPWLRHARALRRLMIVLGTMALSALYLLMYGAYSQGVALDARHAREYLQNVF